LADTVICCLTQHFSQRRGFLRQPKPLISVHQHPSAVSFPAALIPTPLVVDAIAATALGGKQPASVAGYGPTGRISTPMRSGRSLMWSFSELEAGGRMTTFRPHLSSGSAWPDIVWRWNRTPPRELLIRAGHFLPQLHF
jgi:hypothetical protein